MIRWLKAFGIAVVLVVSLSAFFVGMHFFPIVFIVIGIVALVAMMAILVHQGIE